MTTIKSEDVKRLRAETGVGIMDCKAALTKADGDAEKAKQILREEGKELLQRHQFKVMKAAFRSFRWGYHSYVLKHTCNQSGGQPYPLFQFSLHLLKEKANVLLFRC